MSFILGDTPKSVAQTLPLHQRSPELPACDKIVFIIRPELEVIRSVIYQKQCFKSEKEIHILYVPRRTIECDEELERNGVSLF